MKFKAVYDEAAVTTRIRRKTSHEEEVTVLAFWGGDGDAQKAWILEDNYPDDPFTISMKYWEPVPQLTLVDALPGDLWSYGTYGSSPKYRVLGVDSKAGVWHFVSEGFSYRAKDEFQMQYENDNVTVYTRNLPEDDESGRRSAWKLVERP